MARVLLITDGDSDTEVNLFDSDSFMVTEIRPVRFRNRPGIPASHIRIDEEYTFNLYASDHDDGAAEFNGLWEKLREAWLFHTSGKQTKPVYLEAKATNETNTRYATIYGTPQQDIPNIYDVPFAAGNRLEDLRFTLTRGIWGSSKPGVLPSASSLTKTDAPVDDTLIHVANYYDTNQVTVLKNFDASATDFSTNHWGTDSFQLWQVGTDLPAEGDILYIGSTDGPWHHVALKLATAGVFTGDYAINYYSTDAWLAASAGADYTIYPSDPTTNTFNTTDEWAINFHPTATWTSVAVDGDTGYWIQAVLDTDISFTTAPVVGTDIPHSPRTPYIEFDSDTLKGDIPPSILLRHFASYGSTSSDCERGAMSRIIIGAKTRNLTNFSSHLNAAGGTTSDWTVSLDTDSTGAVATNADALAPGGYHAHCTFASVSTMAERVQWYGSNLLDDYEGRYKMYALVEQVGGTDNDISIQGRFIIGSTDLSNPLKDTEEVDLQTHDAGWEAVDLGYVTLPFAETVDTDALSEDLIISLMAERNTGTATLKIGWIVLIPVDEWSTTLDDPLSNTDLGSSALRGDTALDLDMGVMRKRTLKYRRSGSTLYPAETWFRDGAPYSGEARKQTRLYYLMLYYPTSWGDLPLAASLGQHLAVEMYVNNAYMILRGNN